LARRRTTTAQRPSKRRRAHDRRAGRPRTTAARDAAPAAAGARVKIASPQPTGHCPMDVEHINAIGNTLADLTQRTVDLRGYL
jgi:hypothetical protein